MRKLVLPSLLVVLLAVGASPVSAAIVPCGTTTLDTLIGAGKGCSIQDTVFTNFAYTTDAGGKPATDVEIEVVFHPGSNFGVPSDMHGFIFSPVNGTGTWTVGFTLTYTVSVEASPVTAIIATKDQINTGLTPNGAVMFDIMFGRPAVEESGPLVEGILTNGLTSANETALVVLRNSGPAGVDVKSVDPFSVLTLGAGSQLVSFEQDFFFGETETIGVTTPVPEPATLLLLGSGLVAAGLFGRKRLGSRKA